MLNPSFIFSQTRPHFNQNFKMNPIHLSKAEICLPGFKLSVLRSQNAIYFSIIRIPKKFHFTIFVIQIFVQNMKKGKKKKGENLKYDLY